MEFKTGFNFDTNKHSDEHALTCPEPTLAQQQFKEESDINEIVRRFGLTGELPDNYRPPMTGDFSNVTDYHTALTAVKAADAAFMEMPPELRSQFDNDPQKLLDFLDDPNNRAKAEELGIVNKHTTQTGGGVVVESTTPAPTPANTEGNTK